MTCCAEKRESFFGGWLFAVGESWDLKEEGEKYRRRESAEWAFINFYRWIHRHNYSICNFVGYSDGKQGASLYGNFALNPSVISSACYTVNRSHHCTELQF